MIETINELLTYVGCDYSAKSKIIESGQRVVYLANHNSNPEEYVLKTGPIYPSSVARIQRELKILSEIDSEYFPKSMFYQYITKEDISYFVDNIDPKSEKDKIEKILNLNLRPFLVTVEKYIDHLQYQNYAPQLKEPKKLVEYLKHVFKALNILWSKKIVHRDLKPDNILVKPDLVPVVIDLGIAKSLREGTQMITNPFHSSPCTPQFASPEQLFNNKTEVTYKSDQFAIGVIAYHLLTGQFPFGDMQELGAEDFIKNISQNNISSLQSINHEVPDDLSTFIHKLLNIQPFKRFRNYVEIEKTLNEIGSSL